MTARPGASRLLGRSGAGGSRTPGGGGAAFAAAFAGGGFVDLLAAAGTAFLSAAGHLVDGGPGPAGGFVPAEASLFVAFLDVLCLTLLLAGVFRLAASCHGAPPEFEVLFMGPRSRDERFAKAPSSAP